MALAGAVLVGAAALAPITVLAGPAGAAGAAPAAAEPAEPASVPGQLLVGYEPGADATARAGIRSRAGVRLVQRVAARPGRPAVELVDVAATGVSRTTAAARIKAQPGVRYAEPNWIYTTDATADDPLYTGGSLWGTYGATTTPANVYGSGAGTAWTAGNTGSGDIYVGVIDEGIDYNHPDLAANVWTNPFDPVDGVDNDGNGKVDDVRGWDFNGGDNTVYDGTGDDHGTHVAGTIGAVGGNGAGVAGMAWNVKLIPAKFLGSSGGTTANAARALDYLTDLKTRHGLNIVATNNSWGGGGYSQTLLDAINRSGDAGILFVAAAGNGGSDSVGDNNDTTASYPSNYACTTNAKTWDCVVAVAAITSAGAKSGFSNYGASTVDLGAPGSAIQSTLPEGRYGSYSGTSMATPHVTGAAVLWAASHPGATPSDIKAAILGNVLATTALSGKTVTGGRLNVSGFTPTAVTPPPPPPPPPSSLSVTVTKGAKKRNVTPVTVHWTGHTGTSVTISRLGSSFATANDGRYDEKLKGSGSVTYTVCETGSTTRCASGSVTL